MAKRFIETTIWTNNKWFRTLNIEYKILWLYLISNCDAVGVWEEDIEFASYVIGYQYTIDSLNVFDKRLKKINEKKYWIIDFCDFQYGELKEENTNNKPHQSYIAMLKKHSLWIDYKKSLQRLKEKEKDKDKEKDKEKDSKMTESHFEKFWEAYPKKVAKKDAKLKFMKLDVELFETIMYALEWQTQTNDWLRDGGQYIPMPATYINKERWNDEIPKITKLSDYSVDEEVALMNSAI